MGNIECIFCQPFYLEFINKNWANNAHIQHIQQIQTWAGWVGGKMCLNCMLIRPLPFSRHLIFSLICGFSIVDRVRGLGKIAQCLA